MLKAMGISNIEDCIKKQCASLLRRIFAVRSPVQDLCNYFLSIYITNGDLVPDTLVDRIVSLGMSPVKCIFNKCHSPIKANCGVVDTLRTLLMHEHFVKPYSEQHILSVLLTKSFE